MNRLLRISFNTLLNSMLPILMWILLGEIVDKDIANIFTVTYSFQFIFSLFVAIFGTGPNITAQKHGKKDIVDSNILLGTFITFILVVAFSLKIDSYLKFMSLDANVYREYCIYSVVLMFFQAIIRMIDEKLYFKDENKKANKITTIFNITNIILIVILSLIIKNNVLAITLTLVIDLALIIYFLVTNIKKLSLHFSVKDNIKYVSSDIFDSIWMFVIYFVGERTVFGFGEIFIIADNFIGLTTDAQWDMSYSIITAANIDASKDKVNYKQSLKDGIKMTAFLIGSIILMTVILYPLYRPEPWILAIMAGVQIINLIVCPKIWIRNRYIQINYSYKKVSFHTNMYEAIRVMFSFVPTPFCTYIGQFVAMLYDIAVYDIYYKKKFYIDSNGYLKMKNK